MIVYINGQYLAEEGARISIFDRGLLYGDGAGPLTKITRQSVLNVGGSD